MKTTEFSIESEGKESEFLDSAAKLPAKSRFLRRRFATCRNDKR